MRRNPPFDPKYTPILNIYMRPCQNLPLPPRIAYPPFYNYMRHSHNSPSLPEYTPFYIKWGSQNLPHLSRIYPHFLQLYATLPESMSPSQNLPPPPLHMRPFQNLPIPPEYTPFFTTMRHSHNLSLASLAKYTFPLKHLYATLPESTSVPKYTPQIFKLVEN